MPNEIKESENGEVLLTESQVRDIINYAFSFGGNSIFPNAFSPYLINERLKDVNLNPLQATETNLIDALNNVKSSEDKLQSWSQDFEVQSQLYKRLLLYLQGMLSFDLSWECINATIKDYTTKPYQKDLDVLKRFFDNFDYVNEFRLITGELLRNEAWFGCVRFGGDYDPIVLQELPSSPNYTMITGKWSHGLLFSLNMNWFMNSGVSIEMYPKFFARKYNDLFQGKSLIKGYNPALAPELRGNSSFAYWQDVPVGVDPFGWCFKMNPSQVNRHPFFSGLFLDLVLQPSMRTLQKNINLSTASRLLLGQVGKNKDATVKERNQFDISPDLLGKFLSLVKSAISDSIKVAAAPLENMTAVSFQSENGVYPTYLRNAISSAGINSNLIFTNENRVNLQETQLSLNSDEQMMTALYSQFNHFLDYHVNRLTKKFKFRFEFEGTQFYNNRQQRYERQTTLMDHGIVLPQKIAASIGMRPQTLIRMMEESKALNFTTDLMTPVIPGAQLSGNNTGRPQKSDDELSDAGAGTRETGGNLNKGGSV